MCLLNTSMHLTTGAFNANPLLWRVYIYIQFLFNMDTRMCWFQEIRLLTEWQSLMRFPEESLIKLTISLWKFSTQCCLKEGQMLMCPQFHLNHKLTLALLLDRIPSQCKHARCCVICDGKDIHRKVITYKWGHLYLVEYFAAWLLKHLLKQRVGFLIFLLNG